MPDEPEVRLPDLGDSIDGPTFAQILEMDDDEDAEFSKSIVFGFLEQAETTLDDLEKSLKAKDYENISSLGHFLKGSSATLGLNHIKISCEKLQHLGKLQDETGSKSQPEDACDKAIRVELVKLRSEYDKVQLGLKKYYGQ